MPRLKLPPGDVLFMRLLGTAVILMIGALVTGVIASLPLVVHPPQQPKQFRIVFEPTPEQKAEIFKAARYGPVEIVFIWDRDDPEAAMWVLREFDHIYAKWQPTPRERPEKGLLEQ